MSVTVELFVVVDYSVLRSRRALYELFICMLFVKGSSNRGQNDC